MGSHPVNNRTCFYDPAVASETPALDTRILLTIYSLPETKLLSNFREMDLRCSSRET